MNNEIKNLQEKLLTMLLKLDDFCNKNNLTYYLIGGSALGAVRHQGFIPWDDDIDIALMRIDFEKFEKLATGYKISDLLYEPVEQHSFPEAPIGFLYDTSDKSLKLEECPCIDVFALDGVPDTKFKRKMQRYASFLYHISVYRNPAKNRGGLNAFLTKAFINLTPKKLFDFYMRKSKNNITKFPVESSENVANIFGMKRYYNEIMPKIYFGTPVRLPFEGHMLPVPEMYHEYLTHLFGDYNTLPPIEQRQPHHMQLKWEE